MLGRKLVALDEALVSIGDRWVRGEIGREEWLSRRKPLAERVADIRVELARRSRLDAARRLANSGATLRTMWPTLTVEERRGILQAVLDHVVVAAAEAPRQVFRPERLKPIWVQ